MVVFDGLFDKFERLSRSLLLLEEACPLHCNIRHLLRAGEAGPRRKIVTVDLVSSIEVLRRHLTLGLAQMELRIVHVKLGDLDVVRTKCQRATIHARLHQLLDDFRLLQRHEQFSKQAMQADLQRIAVAEVRHNIVDCTRIVRLCVVKQT